MNTKKKTRDAKTTIPDWVIAKPGVEPTITFEDGRTLTVTPYEPLHIGAIYSKTELKKCRSLLYYLDKGLILPYKKGMETQRPSAPLNTYNFTTTVKGKTTVRAKAKKVGESYVYEVDVPEEVKEKIKDVTAEARSKLESEYESLYSNEEPKVDNPRIKEFIGKEEAMKHIQELAKKRREKEQQMIIE